MSKQNPCWYFIYREVPNATSKHLSDITEHNLSACFCGIELFVIEIANPRKTHSYFEKNQEPTESKRHSRNNGERIKAK